MTRIHQKDPKTSSSSEIEFYYYTICTAIVDKLQLHHIMVSLYEFRMLRGTFRRVKNSTTGKDKGQK